MWSTHMHTYTKSTHIYTYTPKHALAHKNQFYVHESFVYAWAYLYVCLHVYATISCDAGFDKHSISTSLIITTLNNPVCHEIPRRHFERNIVITSTIVSQLLKNVRFVLHLMSGCLFVFPGCKDRLVIYSGTRIVTNISTSGLMCNIIGVTVVCVRDHYGMEVT
jgi:hypothetical protein